ncbi:unnamed protein product [Protopolystoma xenopodis]|uniref:Uncharacterized protein n=1 Tax=Protopolystoma xenopodis TaxID=117903 RepID=A0A448XF05_9PLAT|nr:unnamed protein product [Protopolystoma xenopodis]
MSCLIIGLLEETVYLIRSITALSAGDLQTSSQKLFFSEPNVNWWLKGGIRDGFYCRLLACLHSNCGSESDRTTSSNPSTSIGIFESSEQNKDRRARCETTPVLEPESIVKESVIFFISLGAFLVGLDNRAYIGSLVRFNHASPHMPTEASVQTIDYTKALNRVVWQHTYSVWPVLLYTVHQVNLLLTQLETLLSQEGAMTFDQQELAQMASVPRTNRRLSRKRQLLELHLPASCARLLLVMEFTTVSLKANLELPHCLLLAERCWLICLRCLHLFGSAHHSLLMTGHPLAPQQVGLGAREFATVSARAACDSVCLAQIIHSRLLVSLLRLLGAATAVCPQDIGTIRHSCQPKFD